MWNIFVIFLAQHTFTIPTLLTSRWKKIVLNFRAYCQFTGVKKSYKPIKIWEHHQVILWSQLCMWELLMEQSSMDLTTQ